MSWLVKKPSETRTILREYWPVALLFLGFIAIAIYSMVVKNNSKEVYLSTEISGILEDNHHEHGWLYLKLQDQEQRFKVHTGRNYNYSPTGLYEFLENGDQITKRACSDTLHISRGDHQYLFLIEGTIPGPNNKHLDMARKFNPLREIINERNDCN